MGITGNITNIKLNPIKLSIYLLLDIYSHPTTLIL